MNDSMGDLPVLVTVGPTTRSDSPYPFEAGEQQRQLHEIVDIEMVRSGRVPLPNGTKLFVNWINDRPYKARVTGMLIGGNSYRIIWAYSSGRDWVWLGNVEATVMSTDIAAIISDEDFYDSGSLFRYLGSTRSERNTPIPMTPAALPPTPNFVFSGEPPASIELPGSTQTDLRREKRVEAARDWADAEEAKKRQQQINGGGRDHEEAGIATRESAAQSLQLKLDCIKKAVGSKIDDMDEQIQNRQQKMVTAVDQLFVEAGLLLIYQQETLIADGNKNQVQSLALGSSAEEAAVQSSANTASSATEADKVSKKSPPPHELFCPITLQLMRDPVIAMDGHTYERWAIQQVFDRCPGGRNPISPMSTDMTLVSRTLIPNVAIRSMCRECQEE